jgi:hypothetical protein
MKNLFKNLFKPELKRSEHKSLFEALLLVIIGGAFCVFFLYETLTKTNDYSIIISFLLFGGILSFGLWRLITVKKGVKGVVNINSKEYRIFEKGNKFKFILYAGFKKFLTVAITVFLLYFFGALKMNDGLDLWEFLFIILIAIIFILALGFIEYDKKRHTKIKE